MDTRENSPCKRMQEKSVFYLVVGIVSIFCVFWGGYAIRYDPNLAFLYPVLEGHWIVHPTQEPSYEPAPSKFVVFQRKFHLTDPPSKCQVKVTAMTRFRLIVNGQFLGKSSHLHSYNWKKPAIFEIAPQLHQGENIINVEVSYLTGLPALHFQGNMSSHGTALSSNSDWEVSYSAKTDWQPAGIAGKRRKGGKNVFLIVLLILYIGLIALSVFPPSLKGSWRLSKIFLNPNIPKLRVKTRLRRSWIFLIFFILILINTLNVVRYPYEKGFDAQGHIDYIKYVASYWQPPLPNQGWEMFQPPLFYFLAASVYKFFSLFTSEAFCMKAIQFLASGCGTGIVVLLYLTLRKLYPRNFSIQIFGVSIGAFLPILLYMNPLVSNEICAGFVISLALYVLLYYGFAEHLSLRKSLLVGLLVGLALLTKYTGLFIFFVSLFILLSRILTKRTMWRKELLNIIGFTSTVFLLAGWLYVRNVAIFDNAFIGNWDSAVGFYFKQLPGYRTLSFYTQFGDVFFQHPFENRFTSFWDGMYGTLWTDGHGYFVTHPYQITLMRIIIWLAVIPTIAMLFGCFQSIKSILKSPYGNPNLALVLLCVLTLTAVIYFTMEVPFYSTIKAFFFVSLTIPICIFTGKGLLTMCDRFGRLKVIIYADLVLLYVLITLTFQANSGNL